MLGAQGEKLRVAGSDGEKKGPSELTVMIKVTDKTAEENVGRAPKSSRRNVPAEYLFYGFSLMVNA